MVVEGLHYYKNHLTTSLDYLLESYKAGCETGDNQFASYALNQYFFYSFFTGETLYILKDKIYYYIFLHIINIILLF